MTGGITISGDLAEWIATQFTDGRWVELVTLIKLAVNAQAP